MWCRGIRGATQAADNTRTEILTATKELINGIIEVNRVETDAIACAFFTATPDLNAEFPALAARQLGWVNVPLMCNQEMDVPQSMPRCIRVLILVNTDKTPDDIVHVYQRGTEVLRKYMGEEK